MSEPRFSNPGRAPDDSAASGGAPRRPLDWPAEAGLGHEMAAEIRAEVRRRARVRRTVGAAASLAVLAAVLWFRPAAPVATDSPAVASARLTAPERRMLPDGSTVDLKPGAELRVAFAPALRRIELLRGEAHFAVAKDPARPFVVNAAGIEVRAVGTAFSVGRGAQAIDVIVTAGRVAVARVAGEAGRNAAPFAPVEPTLIDARHRTSIPFASDLAVPPQVEPISAAQLSQNLAWRVPRFEFNGTPLAEVVQMFNDHGYARLAVGDPALRSVKVSGVLRADNTEALLELLAADHAIVPEPGGGTTVLRRKR